jgi:hypothetical protein
MLIRTLLAILLLAAASQAQPAPGLKSRTEVPGVNTQTSSPAPGALWIVPAGTRIPLQLRQPVSTKTAQPGDPIYAQTAFPIVIQGQMVIPAGTWVQGVVDSVKRAGRIKGVAELQFHLTTLIYPSGYTLDIAAAIASVPGDTSTSMKEPGTIQHDAEKGKDLERVGTAASQAGQIGALAGAAANPSIRGIGVGGLAGVAAGTLIAILARGTDVRFDTGTAVEIALNQAMAIEPDRVNHPAAP